MKIELSKSALEWQAKAREYADEYLQPHEVEAELNGGVLAEDITARNKARAIELGFSAIDVPTEWGAASGCQWLNRSPSGSNSVA